LVASLVVVAVLLILPTIALHRLALDLRWAAGYVALVSLLAFWANVRDKRLAQNGEWRVSEAQLHFLELIGGWPGAWVAQRWLRHKCSKVSYQFVFWLIVLGYQFAAYDSFHDWQLSRAGLQWIESTSGRRSVTP
jgi:uncharacterized membrane protein YsdA (DUF1294 family)